MRISAKGQYALQMMLDLAINNTGEYITIKSIAKRQNLSEKYLEQIITVLSRANFVRSTRGAKGGYRLAKDPSQYTVGMILRAIEGSLAPVEGIDDGTADGFNSPEEQSLYDLWVQINDAINSVVDRVTLDDLLKKYRENVGYNYMI